jgi:hypothetical protein
VGARAQRRDRPQRWFAVWLAAILATAPFARPSLPVELANPPGIVEQALVAQDDAHDQRPATGLRPAQASTLGILSRHLLLETALGLPPVKPALLRPAPDLPGLALHATTALATDLGWILHRGSVGTARTPTGPPS